METAAWIYFGIGCFALALALLSFIFGEIGDIFHDITSPIGDWLGDHVSFGGDHEVGFSRLLNSGGVLGFLAGFGFVAALATSAYRQNAIVAAGWGIIGGFFLGGIIGVIWFVLQKSGGTSAYSEQQLVGKEAVVTEKIFAGSVGKIECVVTGMKAWHTAKSEGGQEIVEGTTVKIMRRVGSIFYVEPVIIDKKI